jgi:hypothetical protein
MDDYTDDDGNETILSRAERAILYDDSEVIYEFGKTPGCMVLLVGLALLAFEGLVRWFA